MNFGTLKSNILAIIGRAPADMVYELVTADINQEMRLGVMEATTTIAGAATLTLPTDFLEIVSIYRDTDPRQTVQPATAQVLQRVYETSGTPKWYSITDGVLNLSPSPDDATNFEIRYVASLAALALYADVNDVLTTYPSIYVYGALAHHSALIKDRESAVMYLGAYEKAKRQATSNDLKRKMGGTPIVPVVRSTP